MQDFGEKILEIMLGRQLIGKETVSSRGCTPEDIEEMKMAQGVARLPAIYVQFMRLLGRNASPLFEGEYYNCKDVKGLKQRAYEVFREDFPFFNLPSDAFVFYNHQDDYILYFLTNTDENDPPVYLHNDLGETRKVNEYLSDFYFGEIDIFK